MKSTMTRVAAIAAAAALSTAALAACDISSDSGLSSGGSGSASGSLGSTGGSGSSASTSKTTAPSTENPAPADAVRGCSAVKENQETPIFEDKNIGPLSLSALYFQPGQMMEGSMMLPYDKSAAHLEIDTKVTDEGTQWGYAKDETPANMDMSYRILKGDEVVNEGKFMEMNAGDGSHYGTNVPTGVMKDGKYTLEITVKHPTNYALHKDLVTGVEADNWWDEKKITAEWDYKTPVKDANPVRDCDEPAYQPVVSLGKAENPDKQPTKDANGQCTEPEINVGSADAAPFAIDVNYFQPGGMMNQWLGEPSMMTPYQDSIAHLEADIKMVDFSDKAKAEASPVGSQGTDYGYTNGETPANLRVHYTILDKATGATVDEGMFMEMNAGDGSHYGTNLKKSINLVDNTDYTLKLHIQHPEHYSLHIDDKTGVAVRHWYKDFTVEMPWHYTGNQKACIVTPWEQAFPQPVPALQK